MKRIICMLLMVCMSLPVVSLAESDTITITDHAGYEVTLPKEINRVVVTDVYPMASVITVFLSSAEKLVGIHPVSMSAAQNGLLGEMYPEILNADTSFMQGADLNLEALLTLSPDVVFYNAASTALGDKLRGAGFNAVAVSTSKWDYDVLETYNQWIALLSAIFSDNGDKANEAAAYSKEIYDRIQQRVSSIHETDRPGALFLFQYDETQMVTSGKHFFGQFWCDAVGASNVAGGIEADNSNAVINLEQVYEWNPKIVFITNFTAAQPDDLYNNAIGGNDWSAVSAVQNRCVYKLPLGMYRSYTPGIDTPVTLLWLAQKVYPELFADVDMTAEVRVYYKKLFGIELTDAQIARMYAPDSEVGGSFSK